MPHPPQEWLAHRLALHREAPPPGGAALDDLHASATSGRLVIFCGAGLSREFPSLAPIIGDSGIPGLLSLLREAVLAELPSRLAAAARSLLPDQGFEQFLESVAAVAGDEALDFVQILEAPDSRPNFRHLAVARLAAAGQLRALVTVNFDTFLERALEELRVPFFVPEEAADEAHAYRRSLHLDGRLPFLKLHGTLRHRASILTTMETVGLGLPRYKAGALRQLVEGSDILFLGYSDNDVDVFREIEASDLRGTVFWHFLTPPDPALPALERICAFLAARRHWALSGDLDEILAAVLGRIDPAWAPDLLARLGPASFAELAEIEGSRLDPWSAGLLQRSRRQAASWLTPAVSALILRRNLGEADSQQVDLRRDLLAFVDSQAQPRPRVEIAYCNQVAEEIANRGQRTAAIAMRRRLLAKYRGSEHGELAAPLLEEKIRLARHEISGRHLATAILHAWQIRRALRRPSGLPERERARLGLMLRNRLPATLHRLVQDIFARELLLQDEGAPASWLLPVLRAARNALSRWAEKSYRAIAGSDFGAGYRGLAMQRTAELLLLRLEAWTPEVDHLLRGARWRTKRSWRAKEEDDEAQSLGIPDGVRLLYLGNLPAAREHLDRTFRYFARRRDLSGRSQCLLYLAAVFFQLRRPAKARAMLRLRARLKRRYR
jgi:hypothetical protein